ncbi:hypothetical protein BEN47_19470 [Hymenobacter lapidarius]|uniref:Uncharacterized protein n=1 Tax=Hymenobacter lapidarius TaxID=1908237 RepID=A0A1G1TFL0_9BACT|nr:hypothetical protein [Hymenobacter lapidarius]OGX89657.1 hypothetical protein BEN47_19470 [Hymenobacter lapidarius]
MRKPTQSMADMLMQSVATPVVAAAPAATPTPEAGGEKLVAFGQRITATHKEQLSRLAFWSRRNERLLLDRALSEFFARQDSELLRPIPEE